MEQRVLDDGGIELTMPLMLKSIGGHRNVIVPEGNGMTLKQDAVIRAIRNARKWTEMLVTGQAANLTDLAKTLGLAAPYVTRILGLANLAPDIVEAVCSGCEPEGFPLRVSSRVSRTTGKRMMLQGQNAEQRSDFRESLLLLCLYNSSL